MFPIITETIILLLAMHVKNYIIETSEFLLTLKSNSNFGIDIKQKKKLSYITYTYL